MNAAATPRAQWALTGHGQFSRAIRPQVIVCLGATAVRALIGSTFRVSTLRGRFVKSPHAPSVFATLHPSALLRLRDETERETQFTRFVDDLRLIHEAMAK